MDNEGSFSLKTYHGFNSHVNRFKTDYLISKWVFLFFLGFPIRIPTTQTYPIFTAEQRSPLIAKLPFYTFPNITGFQWYNLTTGAAISLPVADTNITKTTLKYELYGHQVDFSNFAYEALFTIENFQHYHEGSYSLVVSNMERMSNFTFRAQISGMFLILVEKTPHKNLVDVFLFVFINSS